MAGFTAAAKVILAAQSTAGKEHIMTFSMPTRVASACLLAALLTVQPLAKAAPASTETAAAVPTTTAISSVPANDALHQQLRDLRDRMQTALNQRDLNSLLDNVADNVVFTTMNGDRVIGKEGIRQYFDTMLNGPNPLVRSVTTQFEVEALSHLYNGDTAVAFGHSNDRYELGNGQTINVSPQWSATLIRHEQRWLIANFHYSANIFDNPVLSAQRQWLLGGAATAALAAALLGFWLGRRQRRKAA